MTPPCAFHRMLTDIAASHRVFRHLHKPPRDSGVVNR
jgi:hypothetical protein